jgi:hypothetical protein
MVSSPVLFWRDFRYQIALEAGSDPTRSQHLQPTPTGQCDVPTCLCDVEPRLSPVSTRFPGFTVPGRQPSRDFRVSMRWTASLARVIDGGWET